MSRDKPKHSEMITITLPRQLVRFIFRFYGLWCGALWIAVFSAGMVSLAHMQPGLSPRENPATSDIAMIGVVGFLLGVASIIYGGVRVIHMAWQSNRAYVPHAVAFTVALPALVLVASSGLVNFFT